VARAIEIQAEGQMQNDMYDTSRRSIVSALEAAQAAVFRTAAFEHALVGMAVGGPDGILLDANEALCSLLGREREEILGKTFSDLTHPDDVEETRRRVAEVLDGSTDAFEMEKRYRRPDGTDVWTSLSLRLVRDDRGAPQYFFTQIADLTARKDAERALAESEERMRTILSSLAEGVCMIDGDGTIVEINESAAAIVGVPAADLLGQTIVDAGIAPVREDGGPPMQPDLPVTRALATGVAESGAMLRLRNPDGRVRMCLTNTQPLVRQGQRSPYAVVCSFSDVTERIVAEQALRASEERYRHLVSAVPVGIFRTDPRGGCTFVNERWSELTGLSFAQAAGDGWIAAIHPDDRDDLRARWAAATGRGTDVMAEFRVCAPDGEVRWAVGRASADRDCDGRVIGYLGSVVDVTERRAAESALRASEEHQRLVLRNLPGASIAAYDRDLRCILVEGRYVQERGLDPDSFVGRHISEIVPAESLAALAEPMRRALVGEETSLDYRSGVTARQLAVHVVPYRDASGAIAGVINISADVTAKRDAEQRQRAAERRFQVVFDRAPIGMCLADLDGRLLKVNAAMSEIVGHAIEDLERMTIAAITHPDDHPDDRTSFEATVSGSAPLHSVEKRYMHAAGHAVWVSVRGALIRDDDGAPLYMLGQVQDITERRRYEDRLEHLAAHDPLTGLLNRRGFQAALDGHIARARRYGTAGALMVLDLDGFKFINDTLGHNAGDELIVSCAGALKDRLRTTDVLARMGGDEFAVLLPVEPESGASTVAQALLEGIRESAGLHGRHTGKVTASIGVAVIDDASLTAEEMLVNADLAMYDAKEAGKDGYAFYSSAEHAMPRIKAHMNWMERIGRALQDGAFVLHAQPVIDLARREIVWHEVLLRMVGAQGELIPPGTFLYIAERFGLDKAIDRWVLTETIRTMARRQADGHATKLSVNLSGASVGDPDLLAAIERELRTGALDPGTLILEITERAAVADIPRARRFAEALQDLGCRFALDDFGAGFGSFYYLKHLPFDVLKIDGEFVKQCASNVTDQLVIKAVTEIARGLGKTTVAEFVPDDRTVDLLRELGVDEGQGFHLGRPQPLQSIMGATR
jgi:diguanylate cyclase (GGDEF)-like protein/PAS domain S-box-containing protein